MPQFSGSHSSLLPSEFYLYGAADTFEGLSVTATSTCEVTVGVTVSCGSQCRRNEGLGSTAEHNKRRDRALGLQTVKSRGIGRAVKRDKTC